MKKRQPLGHPAQIALHTPADVVDGGNDRLALAVVVAEAPVHRWTGQGVRNAAEIARARLSGGTRRFSHRPPRARPGKHRPD